MFNAEIESEKLKEALESAAVLVDECKINFSPEGIIIRAVDPANVAMVTLDLNKSAFSKYESTEGEIGIDLEKFMDILGMAGKSDTINLTLDETTHKLVIQIGGLSYTVSLLDPTTIRKEPKVPQLELPTHIILPGSLMLRAIKAADKVGDYMWMKVQDDTFQLTAEGDTDHVQLTLTKEELIDIKSTDESRSLFSLEYLHDMSKSFSKASEVHVHLGKDYPVKINFRIAGNNGEVNYLLAPRVESD